MKKAKSKVSFRSLRFIPWPSFQVPLLMKCQMLTVAAQSAMIKN